MDEDDVHAVIENYVRGVTKPDVDLVRSTFLPDAHMWGYLDGLHVSAPVDGFLEVVAKTPDPAGWVSDYSHVIRSVEVTGDVAVAVLEESGCVGGDFTNYFSLMRENGTWAIASKTFFLTAGPARRALRGECAQLSSARTLGATSVPSSSMDLSTSLCGMPPMSIWRKWRAWPRWWCRSMMRSATSSGSPAKTMPPGE